MLGGGEIQNAKKIHLFNEKKNHYQRYIEMMNQSWTYQLAHRIGIGAPARKPNSKHIVPVRRRGHTRPL
jgi:hypothetical protein